MDRVGRHEEKIAGRELMALVVAAKPAGAVDDDIDLVAIMRRLRIAAARRIEAHFETAVAHHLRRAPSGRERRLARHLEGDQGGRLVHRDPRMTVRRQA